MKLNARQVETAKPAEKDYKLPDGNGLILLVKTSGAKYWRYRYTFAGKEKMLALGVYPAVSLAAAREKRDEAKRNVAAGVDPVKVKAMPQLRQQRRSRLKRLPQNGTNSRNRAGRQAMPLTFSKRSTKIFSQLWVSYRLLKSNRFRCWRHCAKLRIAAQPRKQPKRAGGAVNYSAMQLRPGARSITPSAN